MELLADQRRFPMQIATALSQSFAHSGLHFFKVNKTVTHVAVARPTYLDLETTPVSEGVRRIVDFINAHPKCNRRKLIEALVPSPAPAPIPVAPAEGEASPAVSRAPPSRRRSKRRWRATCTGWCIRGTSSSLPTDCWKQRKNPRPRPPKPEAKPVVVVPPAAPAITPIEAPVAEAAAPASQPVAEDSSSAGPRSRADVAGSGGDLGRASSRNSKG